MAPPTGSDSRPIGPLAISSPSPSPPLSPELERQRPSWSRARSSGTVRPSTRLGKLQAGLSDASDKLKILNDKILQIWRKLPLWQKVGLVILNMALTVGFVLFVIYNQALMEWLAPKAKAWRGRTGGWLLVWFAAFITAFPPLIGYSTSITVCGFIYGVWPGWLIAASANIMGATCAFVVSRYYLQDWTQKKVAGNKKFEALALVLKYDGLKLLTMIRLCPLPYSLSNGALSTFPTVSPGMLAAATALASPKLLLHVFIGSKLADVGDKKSDGTERFWDYFSIVLGVVVGAVTGWVIWKRTQARSRQLAAEEAAALMEAGQAGENEREAGSHGLAHPDAFADEDAQELADDDTAAQNDDIDFLSTGSAEERYKDDRSDEGEEEPKKSVP